MGELAALFAAFCWGMSAVTVQKGVKKITPVEGAIIATLINVIIFLPLIVIMYFQNIEPVKEISSTVLYGFGLFFLAGIFSVMAGKVLSFLSISYIGSSRTTQLRQSEPVFGILIGVIFLQEYLHAGQWAGIFMVLAGILILARENILLQNSEESDLFNQKRGVMLSVAAGLGFAVSKTVRKAGLNYYPSALMASALNSVGAIVFLIILMIFTQKKHFVQENRNIRSHIHFFILSGVFSSIANLSMSWALLNSEVSTAVVIGSTTPFFALLISQILFPQEEKIDLKLIMTGVLIVSGVSILSVYGQ